MEMPEFADDIFEGFEFIKNNPQFEEKPATIDQFLGREYLNIARLVRPGIRQALLEVFGTDIQLKRIARVNKAMLTGAIGIGKTTFASIALPYMCHWVLCLRDPQEFFSLLPGSRIAFMQMSTSEGQAREVVFGDIFARIQHSKWFSEKYPYDSKYTKQIRFNQKEIWILPGDSAETTFEGYNILGGILDEMDSHKITKDKDYADEGYKTITGRIESRFGKRGLIIPIGQMKKSTGFAARKYAEYMNDPEAHVVRMTLWESYGWESIDPETDKPRYLKPDGTHDSFYFDIRRKQIIPRDAGDLIGESVNLIEVPTVYLPDFQNKPERALKDLAGIPPTVSDPFISLTDKIELCEDRWLDRHFPDRDKDEHPSEFSPVNTDVKRPKLQKWFENRTRSDMRLRVGHVDIAYSGEGDAMGIAMGHVEEIVTNKDGEDAPYIVIDFAMRIKAGPGQEIMLSDMRSVLYHVRDELCFRLKRVTLDGFNSKDTMQQLAKRRFEVEYVSIDKKTLPYEDLREAIYDERIEFPPYYTYLRAGDDNLVRIIYKELSELVDNGTKIDHPVGGSKDVADAIAGVTTTLMGDRKWRRGVSSRSKSSATNDELKKALASLGAGFELPGQNTNVGKLKAPIPPPMYGPSSLISIPEHLRRK